MGSQNLREQQNEENIYFAYLRFDYGNSMVNGVSYRKDLLARSLQNKGWDKKGRVNLTIFDCISDNILLHMILDLFIYSLKKKKKNLKI